MATKHVTIVIDIVITPKIVQRYGEPCSKKYK
jgi:hypothetical protein